MFDGVAWIDAYFIYHSVFILALDFLARPWDERDTAEDLSRKQAIRDVIGALQNVKLCRTFTVLTQVAIQLAKIVGIFDTRSDEPEKTEEYRQYMEQQQATFGFDYGPQPSQNGAVVHNWFQKEQVTLPWDVQDFFGTDGYVRPTMEPVTEGYTTMPTLQGGAYTHIPVIGEEDDLMSPIPPHTAYTHWGTIDTPFAQPRNPSMPGNMAKGPGMH